MPKLYCIDLVKAYVMQESVSSRILSEKKRYDLQSPNGQSHKKPLAKVDKGKKTSTNSSTRFPQASCFKKMRDVCQEYGGAGTT